VTGCRPRGRRSASRLLLCVARLAAVSLRRVLLQRVAGWPLANPPSIALLPSVWRSLRWCKEEWPQGLPTDPHWRHHSTICLSAEGSAATHIRAMLYGSRGRKKRAGFTLLAHLSQDSRLLTLNTCPLGKMLYVPGVASTPSSATSLIGRSFSARA
jgi:hypothetical protein